MDFNNHRLRAIGSDGRMTTVAGNGFHNFALAGTPAVDSPLENPIDFDFLPNGRVVFISYHDPRVIQIDGAGALQVMAGTGAVGLDGNEGDGGAALDAQFIELAGIAVGADGAIYVADDQANRVRVIRGGSIATFAGNGQRAFAGDGGPATAASLARPTALTFDRAGNLLIADNNNHALRRVSPAGIIDTVAGRGQAGFSGDGGPATAALLHGPDGVAAAADGTLYLSDRSNFRVRRVRPDGVIETVAGSGSEGRSGDSGPALAAEFGFLARVSLDSGTLLVADQSNGCVRRLLLAP